jgi:hypothetical protein
MGMLGTKTHRALPPPIYCYYMKTLYPLKIPKTNSFSIERNINKFSLIISKKIINTHLYLTFSMHILQTYMHIEAWDKECKSTITFGVRNSNDKSPDTKLF